MSRPLAATAAVVAAAFFMLPAPPAHACEPALTWISNRSVFPRDGAHGLPLNARLQVSFSGSTEQFGAYEVRLRPVGGAAIALHTSPYGGMGVLVIPDTPLEPATTYELLDNAIQPCSASTPCIGPELQVIATVTTGTVVDTTPPVFAPSFTGTTNFETCDSSACCGPYQAIDYFLDWTDATDDQGAVYYEVLKDDAPPPGRLTGEIRGAVICDGDTAARPPGADFIGGDGSFVVRAVDMAGNVTASAPVPIHVSCHPPVHPCDGGPGNWEGDAGRRDDGGHAETPEHAPADPGCGCRVGAPGPHVGARAALLALLGLALLRSRRKRGGA